ncbi:phosphorylase [Castellaniella sp.]|uniref:ATP adenylyltransferase family protein n=1 Tax=Castellaniella sp. TaxID=1955812 RepID=UPI003561E405
MPSAFMQAVRARTQSALESGALQPIQAEQTVIEEDGLPFIVRWVAALARKDTAPVTLPGGPRNADFNPFLNPEPALLVGPVGDGHVAILNKFPVCMHHLVLARKTFAEQRTPLDLSDFQALAQVLSTAGGLGFYNGGPEAGASQRHKHVQWVPAEPGNATLSTLVAGLSGPSGRDRDLDASVRESAAEGGPSGLRHPQLPIRHVFLPVQAHAGVDPHASAQSMRQAYEQARDILDLETGEHGLLAPHNLLIHDGWLLMVLRSREHFSGVSLNALSFGGTLYARNAEQVEAIRAAGPLKALLHVGVS